MKLLAINGSLTPSSRTREVLLRVLTAASAHDLSIETDLLDLRDYDLAFCDGRPPHTYTGDTASVIGKLAHADVYLVGSPIYRGSYTGALKNLFDLVPNDAPQGKVAGIVATGGSDLHYLAVEHTFRPLLAFFRMHIVPGAVYAQNAHFSDGLLVDADVLARCRRLGEDLVRYWRLLRGDALVPETPVSARKPGEVAEPATR